MKTCSFPTCFFYQKLYFLVSGRDSVKKIGNVNLLSSSRGNSETILGLDK